MKDYPRRFLCIILSAIMLINMVPVGVLAENMSMDQNAEAQLKETPDEAYVVEEIVDGRSEYIKEFQLSNGMRLAAVYSEPVHYDVDGDWNEIDNTLQLDSTRSTNTYINTAGEWQVSFPQRLTTDNGVSISKDGFTLNFRMTGEIHASNPGHGDAEVMSSQDNASIEGTEEELPESANENNAVADDQVSETGQAEAEVLTLSVPEENVIASLEAIDMTEVKAASEYPETVVESNSSRLRYNGIYENTDIIFDLVSNRVKESVVLKSYNPNLRGYSYELNTGEMIPILQETGEIELRNPDNQQVVMHMPAPFLVDNMGIMSTDVEVSLTGSQGTYTLTYTLPKEWLADEERQWPVILDPVIGSVADNTNAEDETFYQMNASTSGSSAMNCGYNSGNGCMRMFVKYKALPAITSADVIVEAIITLAAYSKHGNSPTVVEVREVTEAWSKSDNKKYWDSQPKFSNAIEDYAYGNTARILSWEITDLVRKWYSGTNNGMVFKASDSIEAAKSTNYVVCYPSTWVGDGKPVLTIVYRNNNGLESYWDYTTASAGRAGTGYVNQYTGNLVWVHNDIGFGGNLMPVSISHIYNSNDSGNNARGLGYGWRTNYGQMIRWYGIVDSTAYYIWEDADGTSHYFKNVGGNKYEDEDGLELTFETDPDVTENTDPDYQQMKYWITDKYGNKSYFDRAGRLRKQENNQSLASNVTISYTNKTGRYISSITDGVGRKYVFTYTNGLLSKIAFLGKGSTELSYVSFSYTGTCLTSITDKDGKSTTFTYSNNLMTSAQDVDGYKLAYTYTSGSPKRVSKVSETRGSSNGGYVTFEYAHNQTSLKDHNNSAEVIQFNSWGNTISVQDNQGRAQYAQYALNGVRDAATDKLKGNQLTLSSKMQYTVSNILDNGSFEIATNWQPTSSEKIDRCASWTHSLPIYGNKFLQVRNISTDTEGAQSPAFNLDANETCTFSAYVLTNAPSAYLELKDSTGKSVISDILSPHSGEWVRLDVTYTATAATTLTARFMLVGEGIAFMEGAQVEKANSPSRYNLVENGDFRYSSHWSSASGRMVASDRASAPQLEGHVYKLNGSPTAKIRISQTVTVKGEAGDTYVLAGWAKGNSAPLYDHDGNGTNLTATDFAIVATVYYTDNTKGVFKAQFNPDMDATNDWQYSATAIVAKKAYSSMLIELVYDYNINTAYFDGIQLFKEEFGSSYTYDKEGNVVSVTDLQAQKTTYEYKNNDLTKQILPNGVTFEYKYDTHHNVTYAKTGTGLEYEFTYDDYGNNTSVSISSGDTALISYAEYTDDGNRLESTTDAAGNVTTYEYDADTNVLNWVKYPKDSDASKINYTYDAMYRLAEANMAVGTNQVLSANYTYTDDLLTSVETGSTTYKFTYGDFSLRESIKIGARTLAFYEYTNDRNKYLSALDYGNGGRVQYSYDNLGRLTQQSYEDGDTVTYTYDNSGALIAVTDNATNITTTYYYDFIDRLMRYVEKGVGYTHSVGYGYDDLNNLTTLTDSINGTVSTTAYTYDSDNRVTSVGNTITRTKNGVTETLADAERAYAYDGFSRVNQRVTKNGDTEVINETLTYHDRNIVWSDPDITKFTSGQVDQLTIASNGNSTVYDYTYDANGNITSVKVGDLETTYEYDAANQLIRENNQEANKTWVWEYDNAGNITSRTEYAYTIDENPSNPVNTVEYDYDGTWGDLLTRLTTTDANGQERTISITSDEIGNMTNDGTWSYTWEHGRQLASMTAENIGGNENEVTIAYTYNADGLRTGKTVTTNIYHEHNYHSVATVEPTCTENGYTLYECTCGDTYQGDETAATGHNYEETVTAPSCTAGGYTIYTCEVCDDSYQGNETAALGHSYTETVVDPTPTEEGYTLYTCTVCGHSYKDHYTVHEHSYTSTVVEPTCTTGGYTIHTCECGDSYQDNETAATGHTYTETVVEPTCTEGGYTIYECACGDSYQGNYVDALGHNYVRFKCTRCGKRLGDDGTIPVPTLPPIGGEIMSAGEGETAAPDSASGTENDGSATSKATTGEELVPESTIVTEYDYVYTGDKLAQMTVTTQLDDETPTTETLYFAYDASGNPMSVTCNDVTYYYVTNLQGDVTAILDNTGTSVVEYTYDAWGNILTSTGLLKDTLGETNPLRYRGYVYDQDTGLYYLQSRYYAPELGRFLNADAFVSTGQGLLGNNMFTYCGNNPVNCYDPSGNAYQGIYSRINYNEHDHTYGGLRENAYTLPEETAVNKVMNYLTNQDESVVLDAEYFAFYKGVLVVRTNMDRSGSFGVIFLARNTNYLAHPEDMVRHEYGHVVQLEQLGLVKYALCIFLPSWQEWGSSPYYEKPWEVTADIYGGVKYRNPSQDVIEAGMQYLNQSSTWGPCVWFTID